MGIGRREFLRLCGVAVAGISVNPLQATVTAKDVYLNKKLGILFRKPSEWGFLSVKDFGKLKDEQILGNGWNEYKDELWDDLGSPICVATKYPQDGFEYRGVFSPTLTLQITPKEELEDLALQDFEEVIRQSAIGTAQFLSKFRVLTQAEPIQISGSIFYEIHAEYLFEHKELEIPVMAELKALKTEHGGFYYDFNWHQCSIQNQTADEEFEEFKRSIRLI